ncbi:MAG TPA: hypothetical protein PLO37_16825 [Candidatus Hydrogenedentes bacterium]|nr:hypothetical protein [Candidatus Hydrogenedentota bacterium]
MMVLAVLIYGVWASRDSCAVSRIIPREQAFRISASNLLDRRAKLATSHVWDALPESWGGEALARLSGDLGAPEWVINNLIGTVCHISGNDTEQFSDILFVTKMRRIGCLAEKLRRFVPGIEEDEAGGLNVRRVEKLGVYYAVRGRVLAASPSRDALIRALTLPEDEAMTREELAKTAEAFGGEDLHGAIRFPDTPPPDTPVSSAWGRAGTMLASFSFAVRIDASEACLRYRAALKPQWQERFSGVLSASAPRPLQVPPEGLIELSADLGVSVQALWSEVAEAFESEMSLDDLIGAWTPQDIEPTTGDLARRFLAGLVAPLGPGFALCWRGVDVNEMVPVPEFVGVFGGEREAIAATLASIPTTPEGLYPWDTFPRYDAELGRAWLPMIGGPSIEPTAVPWDTGLLVSTSRTALEAVLAGGVSETRLDVPGNVYVRIKPGPCIEAVRALAMEWAKSGMLRGYTSATLDEALAPWSERVSAMREVSLLIAHEDGEITGELTLECPDEPAAEPAESAATKAAAPA